MIAINIIDNNIWVVGIITAYDEVLSESDDILKIGTHDKYFSLCHKKWRFNIEHGIHIFGGAFDLTEEDAELIRCHLEKKYGIPFDENGRLDYKKIYGD